MNIRYVSRDLEWTPSMIQTVEEKVISPLRHLLRSNDFELSLHFDLEGQKHRHFAIWIVLQTFDGGHNQVVRRAGYEFGALADEISRAVRLEIERSVRPRYWPFSIISRQDISA